MSLSDFWAAIDAQLKDLESAENADDVIRILGGVEAASSGDAFFGGGGGDGCMWESLDKAGWSFVWFDADYYWCMRAPNGSMVTYVEGDVYSGNQKSAGG